MQGNTASTREFYGKALVELGHANPDIVVLGGDLNVSTFTTLFAKEFPHRFFDVGAAEQNMLSIAAGLAASGKIPFCSTFTVFASRALDQIRLGIAQPELNVKLVCTHAGLHTGEDGVSAQGIEDLALMCSLPTMTVLAPADGPETIKAVHAAVEMQGPVYIRLYRPATPIVHSEDCRFQIGLGEVLKDGTDITIICCGSMVATSLRASDLLASQGISARVINFHTLHPADEDVVVKAAQETGAIVTVEEHYVHGGLGSIVAGITARKFPVPVEFVGITQYAESGKANELLVKYGLNDTNVVEAAQRALSRKIN